MVPGTHYTQSDGLSIAYQVIGDIPVDIVLVPGWISNIEVFWEEPLSPGFCKSSHPLLASFSSTSAAPACLTGSSRLRHWSSAWTTYAPSWMRWARNAPP